MSYTHPGNAWTDVESLTLRMVYCDACAEGKRRDMRERFEDGDYAGQRAYARATGERWGYYFPEEDDRCEQCGVIAREQHAQEEDA